MIDATVSPADAHASTGWATVHARGGLKVRTAPSVHDRRVAVLDNRQSVLALCRASGTGFSDGGEQWDTAWFYVSLGTGSGGWVAGHYLRTEGRTPHCSGNGTKTGRLTATVKLRQAPNTADLAEGVAYAGSTIRLVCKVSSQRIRGNAVWYLTDHHRWVSARNVGAAPARCD